MKTPRNDKSQQQTKRNAEGKSSDVDDMGMETNTISKLERRRRIEDLNEERRLREEMSVF
jgi:hypothetical protein